MSMPPAEDEDGEPPKYFLRPGYITTAGSDEIRDRARRVIERHRREMEEAEGDLGEESEDERESS